MATGVSWYLTYDKAFLLKMKVQQLLHKQLRSGKGLLHKGGRFKALATSTMLTTTVLIPFPLPSTCIKQQNQTALHLAI